VLVRVEACGVNFPDVLMIAGKYQRRPPFPFAPGCEIAGQIVAVGRGVQTWRPGDHVLAPMLMAGGFAELVVLPAATIVRRPAAFDAVTGAAFLLTYGTALYALQDRGQCRTGETVLVLGAAGGVGLATIEVAKQLGAEVIAAASTDEKLEFCRAAGAHQLINYSRDDLRTRLKELRGDRGVDVVCDPVGGPLAEPAVRSMAWGGRYLVIGFAQGEIPRIPLNLPLLKSCSIVGVAWGAFILRGGPTAQAHLEALVQLAEHGALRPRVTRTYALSDGAKALHDLESRSAFGKLVVVP
jgi:NADPH2:quinone reductase